MQTYENAYFGLRIDIPDTWKLVSWKHTKLDRSARAAYQTRDDDLPAKGPGSSKFLFAARLYEPDSAVRVDADVEVSVCRVAPGEDMRQTLLENLERARASYKGDGISTSIAGEGTWTIDGVDFGFVDQESKSGGKTSRYRFFFRRIDDALWLYGKIAGHKKRAYAEAIEIVEGMTCNPDNDAA